MKRYTLFTHNGDNGEEIVLGYDLSGNLYVNDKRVVMESKLKLGWALNSAAILAGIGTIGSFVLELLKALHVIV